MRGLTMATAGPLLAAAPLVAQTSDNKPIAPFRIADDLHYVGSSDIGCVLMTSPEGHILIDAGYEDTVPQIEANVAKLGLRLADVKILFVDPEGYRTFVERAEKRFQDQRSRERQQP